MRRLWIGALLAVVLVPLAARAAEPLPPQTRPAPVDEPLSALSHGSVSLPWDALRALLEKGNAAAARPPVDFVFSPATYTAVVTDKTVAITAGVEVTLLVNGWVLVPVGPPAAGVVSATVDGEAAPLVLQGESLCLLVNGGGRKKIGLSIARQTVADAGGSRLDLPLLPTPLVSLSLAIPRTRLSIHAAGATASTVTEDGQRTLFKGTFQGGALAAILWRAAPAVGAAAEARLYADSTTLVTIGRTLLRAHTQLNVEIERGGVKEMNVHIGPSLTVLSVAGEDVADWKELPAAQGDAGKIIQVTFSDDSPRRRTLTVVTERDLPDVGGELEIVPPALLGAKRDSGHVAIASTGTFEVRPGKSAAERVSVSTLPPSLLRADAQAPAAVQIGYHYGQPAALSLLLEKVKQQPAQILATTLTRVTVERGALRCHAEIDYEILHAGVDALRIGLPGGVEVVSVNGAGMRDSQTLAEAGQRTLVVGLKDLAQGKYVLVVEYVAHFDEAKDPSPAVPLLTEPGAAQDRGMIGIEVRDSVEVTPSVAGAERIDVKELPEGLWRAARHPLIFGYRYETTGAKLTLALKRNVDLDVLVAMSDVCEAATTCTSDGKTITKMMFVTRNNLKQYMTLKMPPGAQVWSAFVDDHPVTPSHNGDGDVLIPLKKSEAEDADDDMSNDGMSYRARRERRRSEDAGRTVDRIRRVKMQELDSADTEPDLKPYDVEIVFVTPTVKLAERGQLHVELPRSDVPIGHLSWAVFLPANLRVVDVEGNAAEVSHFTLDFRHFGDVAYANAHPDPRQIQKLEQAQQAQAIAQQLAKDVAEKAKAQGVLPVRIEIPMVGEIHRFEKFLTVDEAPSLAVTYSRKVE